MEPHELARAIVERHRERCAKEGEQVYARRGPIASDLGDCDRQMALGILHWDAKPPFPPEAVENMAAGNRQEQAVIRELEDEGWEIVETQAPFEVRGTDGALLLSGRMEGKIVLREDGKRSYVAFEIKDTSQWLFDRIETAEDLSHVSQWTRKWWRQFQAYLVGHSLEWGILILCHRGKRKPIPISIDYEEGERILARCEQTVAVVDILRGSLDPDAQMNELGLEYCEDERVCNYCAFKDRQCFPPKHSVLDGDVEVRPELAELVARHQELEAEAKEYTSLDRRLSKESRGKHIAAGDYVLTGTWKTINRKAQPAKPAVPASTDKQWKRSIIKVGGGEHAAAGFSDGPSTSEELPPGGGVIPKRSGSIK